jgi:hypothetical protein
MNKREVGAFAKEAAKGIKNGKRSGRVQPDVDQNHL